MKKGLVVVLVVLVLSFGLIAQANAVVVADRPALNAILGSSAVTEDFESYIMGYGSAAGDANVTLLNSSSIFLNQGPGLVISGVSFGSTGTGVIQWNGQGYFGQPSKDISSNSGSNIFVDFSQPTKAFGLDLFGFNGYNDVVNVTVYGADDTAILFSSSNISIPIVQYGYQNPIFWGYSDDLGVGKINIHGNNGWSPMIDNVTFGRENSVVPEPATMVLFGLGSAAMAFIRKRKSAA